MTRAMAFDGFAAADDPDGRPSDALRAAQLVEGLGEACFADRLLHQFGDELQAASLSVYRTGAHCRPTLFLSAARGIPDTTRECWQAYLSGPQREDGSWRAPGATLPGHPSARLLHVTARDIGGEHRARVYDAHGMAERLSLVQTSTDGSLFAVNFYRHQHQRPLQDRHVARLQGMAPLLLALVRKHIVLSEPPPAQASRTAEPLTAHRTGVDAPPSEWCERLRAHAPSLTARELEVCLRLLQGMTHDGIASDLGLGVPTVKTYRNRAFARLGIHFRNQLFALVLGGSDSASKLRAATDPAFD